MTMTKTIGLIHGDGIGPEIIAQAVKVLTRVAEQGGLAFIYERILLGGESIDACGVPLHPDALARATSCDALLMGSVGGPKWEAYPVAVRPEQGLLALRKEMSLYANLRPATLFPELREACPLKEEIIANGYDLMVVRELTGGIYFGTHQTVTEGTQTIASDLLTYADHEIRRIAITAFEVARKRHQHVTSVDKANVLDSSRLWRQVVHEVAADYPDVTCVDMLVDNCAMQLVKNPSQFDVILTENMFGDILSDEASMITGSIGMLPSASLGEGTFGLYEPSHGSAPDIAGQDVANPLATILSASMMLRYSFGLAMQADAIESAIERLLQAGYRTADIMTPGCTQVSCSQMGDLLVEML